MGVRNSGPHATKIMVPLCWVDNPVDIPSRRVGRLDKEKVWPMWLEGPEWLKVPLCSEDERDAIIPDECMEELHSRDETLVMYSTLNEPTAII